MFVGAEVRGSGGIQTGSMFECNDRLDVGSTCACEKIDTHFSKKDVGTKETPDTTSPALTNLRAT